MRVDVLGRRVPVRLFGGPPGEPEGTTGNPIVFWGDWLVWRRDDGAIMRAVYQNNPSYSWPAAVNYGSANTEEGASTEVPICVRMNSEIVYSRTRRVNSGIPDAGSHYSVVYRDLNGNLLGETPTGINSEFEKGGLIIKDCWEIMGALYMIGKPILTDGTFGPVQSEPMVQVDPIGIVQPKATDASEITFQRSCATKLVAGQPVNIVGFDAARRNIYALGQPLSPANYIQGSETVIVAAPT